MSGLFNNKTTITEAAKAFPTWERVIKVGFYKRLSDELIARGYQEEVSGLMAAQGINYITGEDWEATIQNLSPEKKSIIEIHKAEVVPSVAALLAEDKSYRAIIVYFLRIKSILMLLAEGPSDEKQKDIEISDEILAKMGMTRAVLEENNKMFGGYVPKWMKNPMEKRIEKILLMYGAEFPEAPDPDKFSQMVASFHHEVSSKQNDESPLLVVNNKFDGKEYRFTALPVKKHTSVTIEYDDEFSKKMAKGMGLEIMSFDNIVFESFVFNKAGQIKPSFAIMFNDEYGKRMPRADFVKLIGDILKNEKMDDVMNFSNDLGKEKVYKKYGLHAFKCDIWTLAFMSKIRTIFLVKDVK